jgi:hypothetical protein
MLYVMLAQQFIYSVKRNNKKKLFDATPYQETT